MSWSRRLLLTLPALLVLLFAAPAGTELRVQSAGATVSTFDWIEHGLRFSERNSSDRKSRHSSRPVALEEFDVDDDVDQHARTFVWRTPAAVVFTRLSALRVTPARVSARPQSARAYPSTGPPSA